MGYLMFRGLGCGQGCDYAGFGYTVYGFVTFGFVVALASIVLLFLFNRRTWAWTIPGIAIVIIIVGFFIANNAVDSLLPM